MMLLLAIWLAVCSDLVRGQAFNCTEVGGQCVTGTFPDPESCAHYYHCAPGVESGCIKLRHQCPELFAFHKVALQCVLAIDADCDIDGDSLIFATISSNILDFRSPAANPLPFPAIVAKRGHQWNNITNVFTIAESGGLYLIALSVGADYRRAVDFTVVRSGQRYAGISRTSTSHIGVELIGRDIIMPLYAAETVHVSNGYQVYTRFHYANTAITVFSISNSMEDDLVAFSVAREDTLSGSAVPFPFGVEIYNAGDDYNTFMHTFIAPSAGVYYFSFSIGLVAGGTANFILYKNDEAFVNILRLSTSHTGTDTIGRSVMIHLDIFDTVHMVNSAGLTARSSSLKETSFSGFKYQPRHGNQVSWSVARTTSSSSSMNPVTFDRILVNVGNAWQTSSNRAVIPRTGYYFVHLGVGASPNTATHFYLKVNGDIQLAIMRYSTNNNGVDTMARSGILSFTSGAVLDILANTAFYSDSGLQTIFIGFLLY